MNKVQKKMLEVYRYFAEVCQEHGLRFYAGGGTRLGALRHEGFIPWDDDMDIEMPICDMLKLKKIYEQGKLSKDIGLIDTFFQKGVGAWNHYKFFDKRTTYIETRFAIDTEQYEGVFIDIIPLVGSPNDKKKYDEYLSDIDYYRKLFNDNIGKEKRKSDVEKYIKLITKYKFDDSDYILDNFGLHKEYVYNREAFLPSKKVKFENTTIVVNNDSESILEQIYGDWKKLPPINERQGHHSFFIDLNKPYEYYKGQLDNIPYMKDVNDIFTGLYWKDYFINYDTNRLRREISDLRAINDDLSAELDSHLSIKRSIRLTFGNIKRRIIYGKKR